MTWRTQAGILPEAAASVGVIGRQPADNAESRAVEVVLALVVAALVLGGLSLAFRSNSLVADLPITEDAYYAFSVSSHVAHGDGVTVDGVEATNGFQPLFTFLTVPLFVGDDPFVPLRLILVVQVGIFTATGWVLGLVVRDAVPTPRAFGRRSMVLLPMALYLAASFAMRIHLNGLETGFVLLLYAVIWRVYQRRGISGPADAAVLGVLFGLLVLARIDALFAAGVFTLVYLLHRRSQPRRAIGDVCVVGLLALLISSPWWLYNAVEFGSLLPTSGAAQQLWALEPSRLSNLVRALAQVVVPWIFYGDRFDRLWPASAVLIGAGVVLWWAKARVWATETARDFPLADRASRAREFLAVLLIAGGLLAVWYGASSWAVHFYPRYLALLILPAIFLWAQLTLAIGGRAPRLAVGLVSVAALLGLAYTMTFHSRAAFSGSDMWRDQVPLVERTVPHGEVVAAGQSGTLGYFREPVLNLDGKVNAEAYERRGEIADYLVSKDVRWVCDWPSYLHRYLGDDPTGLGWVERAREGQFRCLERVR